MRPSKHKRKRCRFRKGMYSTEGNTQRWIFLVMWMKKSYKTLDVSDTRKATSQAGPVPVQSTEILGNPYHRQVPLPRIPDNRAQDSTRDPDHPSVQTFGTSIQPKFF